MNGLFSILENVILFIRFDRRAGSKGKAAAVYGESLRTGHEKILEHTVQKVVRSRNGGTVI